MKKINVKKKQILQRTGDLRSKVYQVESGLLRSYTIDENGKEHIFMFGPEGWIVSDYVSQEQPCDLFIDALEDSVSTYPNIIQRVPQHMVASYLGITPEALSAVKSQHLKSDK